MMPFTIVTGPAAPLLRANIDTDVIIRIERLTALVGQDLGRYALEALRFRPDGSEEPDFILNQQPFRAAPILLAGENFGCGSSREPAVTALIARGIRCVVAPSFGDIFYSNCFQNGMLPVKLSVEDIEAIAGEAAGGRSVTVDLRTCTITTPSGGTFAFRIDGQRRESLLRGLDDVALTLEDDQAIREWQRLDRLRRPWAWPRAVREITISAPAHPSGAISNESQKEQT